MFDKAESRINFVETARLTFEDWTGLKLSNDVMDKIIGDELEDEWSTIFYKAPATSGLDTCVRERMQDLIAQYFLGEYWPCYGDNVDFEIWGARLVEAINKGVKA